MPTLTAMVFLYVDGRMPRVATSGPLREPRCRGKPAEGADSAPWWRVFYDIWAWSPKNKAGVALAPHPPLTAMSPPAEAPSLGGVETHRLVELKKVRTR